MSVNKIYYNIHANFYSIILKKHSTYFKLQSHYPIIFITGNSFKILRFIIKTFNLNYFPHQNFYYHFILAKHL